MCDFAKGVRFRVSDIVRIGDKKAVYQVEILSDLIITITGELLAVYSVASLVSL